ncbi:MAG: branched-chain-amino-acid transaminase [Candidatus Omnitrophota bacterium]
MGFKVYIDGNLIDKDEAMVSVFDHGFLYGDGVFEGIRSYNGLVFKLQEHIDRLYESAHALMLSVPLTKEEMIRAVILTLKINGLKDAYIRLVITRGKGDLGLDPRKCKRPTVVIITDKVALYPQEYYKNGLEIKTVPTLRNMPEALNPQIKSLNYLNNILAKIEAINSNVEEALMLNSLGYVTEGTGDNVFIVKKGVLLTPPAYVGILKGITRGAVIEIAKKKKISVMEEVLTRHSIYNADEVFLTGTAAEIIPVVKVDARSIGNGKPGTITNFFMKEFRKLTKTAGVRIK